jgi:hypothetical protein
MQEHARFVLVLIDADADIYLVDTLDLHTFLANIV